MNPSLRQLIVPVLISALPAMFAATGGPPPVTVEGSVSVQGPVTVQGVVEVLNDVLRQPYVRTGVGEGTSPIVNFDIPDGKRLIIETVSFQAATPTGVPTRMFLEVAANNFVASPLVVQSKSIEGSTDFLMSTIQMTVRLNSILGSTSEFRIRRGTGGAGSLTATVYGYLVDIGS
jgi:hypothetical protein